MCFIRDGLLTLTYKIYTNINSLKTWLSWSENLKRSTSICDNINAAFTEKVGKYGKKNDFFLFRVQNKSPCFPERRNPVEIIAERASLGEKGFIVCPFKQFGFAIVLTVVSILWWCLRKLLAVRPRSTLNRKKWLKDGQVRFPVSGKHCWVNNWSNTSILAPILAPRVHCVLSFRMTGRRETRLRLPLLFWIRSHFPADVSVSLAGTSEQRPRHEAVTFVPTHGLCTTANSSQSLHRAWIWAKYLMRNKEKYHIQSRTSYVVIVWGGVKEGISDRKLHM